MAGKRIDTWAGFTPKKEDNWRFKVKQDMHFKNFYRSFDEYLKDNEFRSLYEDDKFETFYDEKHLPNGEREYRIRWRAYDITPNSTYVVLKHTFDWLILECKDKKAVIDGKKITIQSMEIEIESETYVLVNKEMFKKSKFFLMPFFNLFWDRWFRYLYEGYKGEAKKNSKDIEEYLKNLLDVARYTDDGIQYNRSKGFENPNK